MKLRRVTEFMKDTLSSETLAAISNRANKLTQSIKYHTGLIFFLITASFFSISQLSLSKKAEQRTETTTRKNQTTTR